MNWNLFHLRLFRYDLQAQCVRQGACCCIGWKMITFQDINDEVSRHAHGYPFYYKRLEKNKSRLVKLNLEKMYDDSLDEEYDFVTPIYS